MTLCLINQIKKTAFFPCMASRPIFYYFYYQGISITVSRNIDNLLKVAACFSFSPEFVPAPAEKAGPPLQHCNTKTFFIHICQSQYFFTVIILYNGSCLLYTS